jgi:hypothetical protein
MKRKQFYILGALVAVTILLFWHFRQQLSAPPLEAAQTPQIVTNEAVSIKAADIKSPTSSAPTTTVASPRSGVSQTLTAQQRQAEMNKFRMLWRTPIVFYGKIIDESNQPIAGVHISYGANSLDALLLQEVRNEGTTSTDSRGIFKISGIRGRSFVFELSHPSYYNCSTNPSDYGYADQLETGNGVPDTEDKAMLFYMHHKGNPVALIKRGGGMHTPADGTVMDVPFRGKRRDDTIGRLQGQAWKGEADPLKDGRYDWKVIITVPGGGIMESSDEFAFVAPESGYQQSFEIRMSKDNPSWKSGFNKKFFFKLPNYFARGQIDVDLFHDFYFSMDYFVNPDGSANLENDPTQSFQEP